MKILALDGDVNTCVVSVRALAQAGHRVIVGAPQPSSKAGWSRYCQGTFTYPAPQVDAAGFVDRVAREAAKQPGTLVLPMTEPTTVALSAARHKIFSAGGRMVLPSHECILRAHDKHQTTALARSLGIPVPNTTMLGTMAEARAAAPNLPYPVVLKPRTSEEISSDGRIPLTGYPDYARNPEEFLQAFASLRKQCSWVMVQDYIEGKGAGYFALMHHGELRAEFAHLRLREVRPTGSGSCLRVSTKPIPAMRESALQMLRALDYHGAVMIEYRLRPDNTPVFLEANPRLWNSVALAIYSGVNFPVLLAEMAERGDVASPMAEYRAGVRCRWIVGDCRHLMAVWRGKPSRFPGLFPGRIRSTLEFLKPVRGTFHDPFCLSDPMPEIGDWLHSFRRFFQRRLQRKPAAPIPPAPLDTERSHSAA